MIGCLRRVVHSQPFGPGTHGLPLLFGEGHTSVLIAGAAGWALCVTVVFDSVEAPDADTVIASARKKLQIGSVIRLAAQRAVSFLQHTECYRHQPDNTGCTRVTRQLLTSIMSLRELS
jgi:hypothetical protein